MAWSSRPAAGLLRLASTGDPQTDSLGETSGPSKATNMPCRCEPSRTDPQFTFPGSQIDASTGLRTMSTTAVMGVTKANSPQDSHDRDTAR